MITTTGKTNKQRTIVFVTKTKDTRGWCLFHVV